MAGTLSGMVAKMLGRGGTVAKRLRMRRFAESLYRRALSANPAHAGAAYGCGRLRERRADFEAAVAAYSTVIDGAADTPAVLFERRSVALRHLDRWDESVADLLAAELTQPRPFVRLGDACRKSGQWPQAAQAWERVRRLAPEDTKSIRRLAESYVELGNWGAACVAYRTAIAAGDDSAKVRSGLAKAARLRAKVPFELRGTEIVSVPAETADLEFYEGLAQLRLAAESPSATARTAFQLGRFLEEDRRLDEAAQSYRLALSRLDTVNEPWVPKAVTAWTFRLNRVAHLLHPTVDVDARLRRSVFPGIRAAAAAEPAGYFEGIVDDRGLLVRGFMLDRRPDEVELFIDGRSITTGQPRPHHHLPAFVIRIGHTALDEFPRQSRLSARTTAGSLATTGSSQYLSVNVPDGSQKLPIFLEDGHHIDGLGRLVDPAS